VRRGGAAELEQRRARAREERCEKLSGTETSQCAQLGRQREHHVKVLPGEQPLGARSDPSLLRECLALGAVPVAQEW
jgi:hypothetical protein